jgi:Penicillin-insensitive murein endopeptidase
VGSEQVNAAARRFRKFGVQRLCASELAVVGIYWDALNLVNTRRRGAVLTAVLTTIVAGFCGTLWSASERAHRVDVGPPIVLQPPVVRLPPSDQPSKVASMIARPAPVTVQRFDDEAFKTVLNEEPTALGAIALGRPNRGSLFNAMPMPNTDARWKLEVPEHSFGTEEAVRGIEAAIAEVNRLFPNTPALSIGHLSSKDGGWLRPHRSHQNGRDVDLGFYYRDGSPWYRKATRENLDVPRTWALLSALERAAGLEYAFVDQSLHQALREHAESIGESQEFLVHMFDGPLPVRGPTIRHERGHLTHLHVRFSSPIAVENAHRVRLLAGKGARNSNALAQVLQRRQGKRLVADREVPKQRTMRSTGRGKSAIAPRTKLL